MASARAERTAGSGADVVDAGLAVSDIGAAAGAGVEADGVGAGGAAVLHPSVDATRQRATNEAGVFDDMGPPGWKDELGREAPL
jgi:hypothetical protein